MRSPTRATVRCGVDLILDGTTGAVVKRTDFHSKPWLDRAIGIGIAAHEGQLFGALNQLVSLFTTVGLVLLSVSGLIMWWRRKPEAALGAPVKIRRVPFSAGLVAVMIALGVYFPLLGGLDDPCSSCGATVVTAAALGSGLDGIRAYRHAALKGGPAKAGPPSKFFLFVLSVAVREIDVRSDTVG